jgi:hypothetical protein
VTTVHDKVTRFAADLVDSAAVEGARQSRSGKQQLDHWARVGRAVSEGQTAARRRIEAALSGSLPMRDLSADERVVLNAEIEAAIQEKLQSTHFGSTLRARGVTTVALGENGDLVEHRPDGSTSVIDHVR